MSVNHQEGNVGQRQGGSQLSVGGFISHREVRVQLVFQQVEHRVGVAPLNKLGPQTVDLKWEHLLVAARKTKGRGVLTLFLMGFNTASLAPVPDWRV